MRTKRHLSYNKRYKIRKRIFYKKRWFWDFVLILLLALSASWLLFKTPYFQVQEVNIAGETKLSNSIKDVIGQNLNFFLLNTSSISQKIRESFPKIQDIKIQKKFPNEILITVLEKKAIGMACQQKKLKTCFLLSSDGTIFEKAKKEKNLPKFIIVTEEEMQIGKSIIGRRIIGDLIFLQNELRKLRIFIEEIHVLPYELQIRTKDDFEIYFSKDDNLRAQIEILISALQKTISKSEQEKLKYIDVRGVKKDGKGEIYFK